MQNSTGNYIVVHQKGLQYKRQLDSVLEVLISEVQHAVKQMKNNKAQGDDEMVIDIIKEAEEALYKPLSRLFTNCLRLRIIPTGWNNAIIILLCKNSNVKDINNYDQ